MPRPKHNKEIIQPVQQFHVPNVIVKPPVLTPHRVAVKQETEYVVITIGNSDIRMHYTDAFKLSQWIRVRAKQAKKFVGDTSQHWSVVGVLSDDELEGK